MTDLLHSETFQVIVLAIVQGISEFLPISSDGHLIAVESLLPGIEDKTEINLILHFGTLLSIIVFYWRQLLQLLTSDRRVIPLLILGTVPVAIVGVIIKKKFPELIENPLLGGFMLVVMGLLLLLMEWIKGGETDYRKMAPRVALLIGIAQVFALLPGISRSGTTISFLLAVPAIAGATLLEGLDIYEQGGVKCDPQAAFLGCALAFVIGLVALNLLVRLLNQGKLHWFAYWLIPFGVANVVWQLYLLTQSPA
ncbi:MAG: undecaprenyl-diphosphate phosphatase [Blastopirellula sp.]|nr:undecaprenyl-diphosphate phosphatase [Blastopirellula sp.]